MILESLDVGSSYSHIRYISRVERVKFVYEGHWVKVKVIGAKMVKYRYSRNVKLQSAIKSVL